MTSGESNNDLDINFTSELCVSSEDEEVIKIYIIYFILTIYGSFGVGLYNNKIRLP
jgi:hypothetical protein